MLIVGPELFNTLNYSHWLQTLLESISLHEVLIPKLKPCTDTQGRAVLIHDISKPKIIQLKIAINIFIIMHMHKESSARSSFLDKFQGKNQKINRDGLLQMLNSKLPIQTNNKKTNKQLIPPHLQSDEQSTNILKLKLSSKHTSKGHNIFNSVELKAPKSERALDKMAFHLIRQQSDKKGFQFSNQFKLPTINRSKSQNGNIKYPSVDRQIMESQKANKKKSNSGSFYSKNSDKLTKKMQLDEYILRHLEFLNKFEKQLIGKGQVDNPKIANP